MTSWKTDIAVYAILLGTSLLWCGYVVQTIPPGTGGGDVGPRALPLLLGVLLGLLSAGVLLKTLFGNPDLEPDAFESSDPGADQDGRPDRTSETKARDEWIVIALVFGLLFVYGWALRMVGFNLATLLTITLTMLLCLRERSPVRIATMSVGVTAFCWLIFGQLLDIPLATGIWINLG